MEQPAPIPNESQPIVDMLVLDVVMADGGVYGHAVIADLMARKRLGIERYGVALQAFNGRDMGRDAYEEALDLAVYLRGELAEDPRSRMIADDLKLAIRLLLRLRARRP